MVSCLCEKRWFHELLRIFFWKTIISGYHLKNTLMQGLHITGTVWGAEFQRLQYSIWSSLPPSAKHGDNKTSPSKSWLMALWSAVTLMWHQAINTTVPEYTTRHIMEYCIYIYIATFTETNLSQLHGTQATFGTSDLLELSPTSPVGGKHHFRWWFPAPSHHNLWKMNLWSTGLCTTNDQPKQVLGTTRARDVLWESALQLGKFTVNSTICIKLCIQFILRRGPRVLYVLYLMHRAQMAHGSTSLQYSLNKSSTLLTPRLHVNPLLLNIWDTKAQLFQESLPKLFYQRRVHL